MLWSGALFVLGAALLGVFVNPWLGLFSGVVAGLFLGIAWFSGGIGARRGASFGRRTTTFLAADAFETPSGEVGGEASCGGGDASCGGGDV